MRAGIRHGGRREHSGPENIYFPQGLKPDSFLRRLRYDQGHALLQKQPVRNFFASCEVAPCYKGDSGQRSCLGYGAPRPGSIHYSANQIAGLLVIILIGAACAAQTANRTPTAGPAPPGSLRAILAGARERVEKSDVRASGRLVEIASNGTRTNNTLALESHSFPDGLRTLVTVTAPDHSTTRYLLTQNVEGRTTIEVAGKGAAARLPVDRWSEGVAGTLFYPEDFADGQFFWTKQTVLLPAKYGARECYVLKSEPGPGQPTVYASVTTWIDQKTGAPVFVEAMPKNGGGTKQFVFYGIEQIGGIWLSRQVEVKESGKPGSSMMLIEHGSDHAHLERKDFELSSAKGSGPGQ